MTNKSQLMNTTIDYYNNNAESFTCDTIKVNFENNCERFLQYIPDNGSILDFGCGAGRDTRYFLNKGYDVHAIDGSHEMCRIAGEYTGINVKQQQFADFAEYDKYDGIWACASILHLPKDELEEVLIRLLNSLKQEGFIYTSFKYGTFEGVRNGRYFTYFTENTFSEFEKGILGIEVIDEWISDDVRKGRENEKWLNLILKKVSKSNDIY